MTALTVAVTASTKADVDSLSKIDEVASKFNSPEIRDAFAMFNEAIRTGRHLIVASADELVTTTQAAKALGVSRAHLYKVLDSGALPFKIVGAKDRRIAMSDLRDYINRTEDARKHAAIVVANPRSVHAAAIDEM